MFEAFLIPQAKVTGNGDGQAVDLSGAATRVLLLSLDISEVIEQESLDVSVWGSPDGANWGQKPLVKFPQKFYRGEHPLLLDLGSQPEVKFLRAHWELNRWGRGDTNAMFEFNLQVREVPAEVLVETSLAPR
jgi:hypothetical protein